MSDQVTLSAGEQAVISALEKLNVVELNNVVKYMEQAYGISAQPVAVAAGGGAAVAGGVAVRRHAALAVRAGRGAAADALA